MTFTPTMSSGVLIRVSCGGTISVCKGHRVILLRRGFLWLLAFLPEGTDTQRQLLRSECEMASRGPSAGTLGPYAGSAPLLRKVIGSGATWRKRISGTGLGQMTE